MAQKIPATGPGSRDPKSYGAARLFNTPFAQDVAGVAKKIGSSIASGSNAMIQNEVDQETRASKNLDKVGSYFTGTGQNVLGDEKKRLDLALKSNTSPSSPTISAPTQVGAPVVNPRQDLFAKKPSTFADAVTPTTPGVPQISFSPKAQPPTQLGTITRGGVTQKVQTSLGMNEPSLVGPGGQVSPVKGAGYIGNGQPSGIAALFAKPGTAATAGVPGTSGAAAPLPGAAVPPVGGPEDKYMKDAFAERSELLAQKKQFMNSNPLWATDQNRNKKILANASAVDARLGELDKTLFGKSQLASALLDSMLKNNSLERVGQDSNADELSKQKMASESQIRAAEIEAQGKGAELQTKNQFLQAKHAKEMKLKVVNSKMTSLLKLRADNPMDQSLLKRIEDTEAELNSLLDDDTDTEMPGDFSSL